MVHGPLARYAKLRVALAPVISGRLSLPPWVSDPGMHHGTCVTHVPWSMPGSLTGGFLLSRWREKRSRHSQRLRNPQFYVSGKRPMTCAQTWRISFGCGMELESPLRRLLRWNWKIKDELKHSKTTDTIRMQYMVFSQSDKHKIWFRNKISQI